MENCELAAVFQMGSQSLAFALWRSLLRGPNANIQLPGVFRDPFAPTKVLFHRVLFRAARRHRQKRPSPFAVNRPQPPCRRVNSRRRKVRVRSDAEKGPNSEGAFPSDGNPQAPIWGNAPFVAASARLPAKETRGGFRVCALFGIRGGTTVASHGGLPGIPLQNSDKRIAADFRSHRKTRRRSSARYNSRESKVLYSVAYKKSCGQRT